MFNKRLPNSSTEMHLDTAVGQDAVDGSVHLDLCGKAAEYRILLGHVASLRLFANVTIV